MDSDSLYRFHHHLVRDTVYGGLLKRARATLHVDFVRWADQVNAERGRALEFEAILGYHLEQAHNYLAELGPLDEKGREIGADAARRLASAGPARLRAWRRARRGQPAAPGRRAASQGRPATPDLAARARRSPPRARPVRASREPSSTKRSKERGSRTTARSRHRRGWPACSFGCTAARRAAGATPRWSSRPRHPAARAAGGACRAGQGLAPRRHGPADRRPAGQGEQDDLQGHRPCAPCRRRAPDRAQRARHDDQRGLRPDTCGRRRSSNARRSSPASSPIARCRT